MSDRRRPLDEYVLPLVRYRTRAGVLAIAVIALVVGVGAQLIEFAAPADASRALGQPWMPYVVVAGSAVCLLLKLRWPVVAVAGAGALVVVDVAGVTGGLGLVSVLAFFDCIYAAMLHERSTTRRLAIAAAVAVVASLGTVWLALGDVDLVNGLRLGLSLVLLIAAPAVWGMSVRQRDELLAAETARADAVARAADAERDRAVRDERAAMARELHDEIAARLSAIALQSAALSARVPAGDEAAAASIRAMRSSSVEALEELRQLIAVLTTGREGDDVAVGIDDVGALRHDAERFGVALEAEVDVAPGALGSAASHALMRIARESLANAARHAPGAPVRLRVAVRGEAVALDVENRLVPSAPAAEGNGLGTSIMAQRWHAVGGSGSVGATDDGRWVVHATVPRQEAVA